MIAGLSSWRFYLAAAGLLCLPVIMLVHLAKLQVVTASEENDRDFRFLQKQGDARTLRQEPLIAYRGKISDRNGELLAVSTPVKTIYVNPQAFAKEDADALAKALGLDKEKLVQRLELYRNKQFMYVARHLPPYKASRVEELNINGVFVLDEFRRFYPAGETTAHLVGFTDVDDRGREGMELAYNEWLEGEAGARQVLKDRQGQVIKSAGLIKAARPGNDLELSIDLRLQYIAYRELKSAIRKQGARGGSVVVLDAHSSEVLAMVNQPSFNPNNRKGATLRAMRNSAVVDIFEPGSTAKPFTVIAGLQKGVIQRNSSIETSPGHITIANKTFLDPVNYGTMNVSRILQKSSQVGITKIAMQMPADYLRDVLSVVGFGESVYTGFPGEASGNLPARTRWHPHEHANIAFGYGFSTTALQLAQAYAVLANRGLMQTPSLLRVDPENSQDRDAPRSVLDHNAVSSVAAMLESVTKKGGTGTRAAIGAFDVAGKTGTAHKVSSAGGYAEDKYRALFAGFAPAKAPRLVAVVVIDEPPADNAYHGGQAAAPVFSAVVSEALQVLHVAPDHKKEMAADAQRDTQGGRI